LIPGLIIFIKYKRKYYSVKIKKNLNKALASWIRIEIKRGPNKGIDRKRPREHSSAMHEYMAESIQDRRRTTTRMAKLLGGSHHSKWSSQYYGVYSFCCCDLLLDYRVPAPHACTDPFASPF